MRETALESLVCAWAWRAAASTPGAACAFDPLPSLPPFLPLPFPPFPAGAFEIVLSRRQTAHRVDLAALSERAGEPAADADADADADELAAVRRAEAEQRAQAEAGRLSRTTLVAFSRLTAGRYPTDDEVVGALAGSLEGEGAPAVTHVPRAESSTRTLLAMR